LVSVVLSRTSESAESTTQPDTATGEIAKPGTVPYRQPSKLKWILASTLGVASIATAWALWFDAPNETAPEPPIAKAVTPPSEVPAPTPSAPPADPPRAPPGPPADNLQPPPAVKTKTARVSSTSSANGYLSVNSNPWGAVFLDGQRIADQTPLYRYPVPSGRHEVSVFDPKRGVHSQVQSLMVQAGKTHVVGAKW
jgi:hypothetical protein